MLPCVILVSSTTLVYPMYPEQPPASTPIYSSLKRSLQVLFPGNICWHPNQKSLLLFYLSSVNTVNADAPVTLPVQPDVYACIESIKINIALNAMQGVITV